MTKVILPAEATEEMLTAAKKHLPGGHGQVWVYIPEAYLDMIAAAPNAGAVSDDELEKMSVAAVAWRKQNADRLALVQGFQYGNRYVVRDICLEPGSQEVWSCEAGPVNSHAQALRQMINFIDTYKERIVFRAALAAIGVKVGVK